MNGNSLELKYLTRQIEVARNELKNLRQNILKLKKINEKQVKDIISLLKSNHFLGVDSLIGGDKLYEPLKPEKKSDNSSLCPIGHVRSMFKSKNGTPRQPSVCSLSKATVHINKSMFTNPEHVLSGLSEFSHIWLIFLFDQNNPDKTQKNFTKSKVHPPRLNGNSVGVFATRSPHRPNPIGLTLTHLEKIEGAVLHIAGVDLLDGTPVLDIKPYIPMYDIPKDIGYHLKEISTKMNISENVSSEANPIKCSTQSLEHSFSEELNCGCKSVESTLNLPTLVSYNSFQLHGGKVHDCKNCLEVGGRQQEESERSENNISKCILSETSYSSTNVKAKKDLNIEAVSLLPKLEPQNYKCKDDSAKYFIFKPVSHREEVHLEKCAFQNQIQDCSFVNKEVLSDENCDSCSVMYGCGTVASWLSKPPIPVLTVGITARAENELSKFHGHNSHDGICEFCLNYFSDVEKAKLAIKDLLQADPRSQYRRQKCSDRLYFFALDTIHITCWFDDHYPFVEVIRAIPVVQ